MRLPSKSRFLQIFSRQCHPSLDSPSWTNGKQDQLQQHGEVLRLDACNCPWQAFEEYYYGARPVILQGASDLSSWSTHAWVGSFVDHRTDGDTTALPGDLFIRGHVNTLSQRGNACILDTMTPAGIVSHIFSDSCDGIVAANDTNRSPFFQWRTRLALLSCGHEKHHQRDIEGQESPQQGGTSLPPCVPLPTLLREWPGVRVRPDGESALFVTSAGGRTAMHRDELDNVLLHLCGHKNVIIVEPEIAKRHPELMTDLFTTPGSHAQIYKSKMDRKSDENGYAGTLEQARSMPHLYCSLQPGDLLYIPNGWFHDVESQTATVSAALRFDFGKAFSVE